MPLKRTWLVGTCNDGQPGSVRIALVAEWVVFRGDQQRRRRRCHDLVAGKVWRHLGIGEIRAGAAEVVIDEPTHARRGQLRAVGVFDEARKAAGEIRGGVHQELITKRNRRQVTDEDRKRASGGVAADRDPVG